MDKKIDWIIHCCANGYCEECGEIETGFLPFLCNAHTHGMERYGHMDFQLVLRLRNEEIMYILNTLGPGGDFVTAIWCLESLKTAMCV